MISRTSQRRAIDPRQPAPLHRPRKVPARELRTDRRSNGDRIKGAPIGKGLKGLTQCPYDACNGITRNVEHSAE